MKKDLMKLLDDPEVVAKLRDVLFSNKNEPKSSDITKIRAIKKFWGEESQDKNLASAINVAIKKHGMEELKSILQLAKDSPLNKDGQMMQEYLSDLSWCIREVNLQKIKDGKYSKSWDSGKQPKQKQNSRDDKSKLEKLMK